MPSIYTRTRRSRIADIVVFAVIVLVILAVLRFLPRPEPVRLSGHAQVIDGDSLVLQGAELRLKGIDAPEAAQECMRSGKSWPCGRAAARALAARLRAKTVICSGNERDAHDRLLATCKVGSLDVNKWLVEQGWAVSFHGFPAEESSARAAKRGIWAGPFMRPREWRELNQ